MQRNWDRDYIFPRPDLLYVPPVMKSKRRYTVSGSHRGRCDNLGLEMQFNAWILNDSLDEIARHCFGQFLAANQHVDLAYCLCQEDCCLTGRVAAANHNDLLACAQLCFHGCGGVVDALPLESFQILDVRLVVLSAGSNNNAARGDATAIFQGKLVRMLIAPD